MENDSKCPVVQNMFYLPKIRALASHLYVYFPHCMPFFTFSSVFHTLSDLLSNLTSFFLTLYSFFLWMTHFFHSFNNSFNFLWQNIHSKKKFIFFWEALFKLKISFIQNNAVLFIQKNYSFFWKVAYRTGLIVPRLVPKILSKCAFCDEAVAVVAVGIGDSRSLM